MSQKQKSDLRYLPDTKDQVAQTTKTFIGKIESALRDRIAFLKGKR